MSDKPDIVARLTDPRHEITEQDTDQAAYEIERLRICCADWERTCADKDARLAEADRLLTRWKVAAETGHGDLGLYAATRDFLAKREGKP